MALTKVSGPLLHGSNNNLGNYVINNITGAAATFTSLDCSNIDLSADDLKIVGIITNSVLTPGTVVWVGTGNTLTESDNLTWDNTNVRLKNLGITSTKNLNVTGVSTFSGRVGMGTNSPTSNCLHIAGNGQNQLKIQSLNNTEVNLNFINTTHANNFIGAIGGDIFIYPNGTERVRVLSDGKVGIGITNPDEKLTVNGKIEARGGSWFIARSGDNSNYAYIRNPDTSNSTLAFNTSGEKMRIDSTGRALIGTTSSLVSSPLLQVYQASSGSGAQILIRGDGNSYCEASVLGQVNSSSRGSGWYAHDRNANNEWFWGRPYSGNDQFIIARKTSPSNPGQDTAQTANSIMTVQSGGNVSIDDGNLLLASGHGIDFSATANSGGSMSSELLDDYEEGTFSPVFNGSNGGGTSRTGAGFYTKVGDIVTCFLQLNNADGSNFGGGYMKVTGLPYAATQQSWTTNIWLYRVGFDTARIPMFYIGVGDSFAYGYYSRNDDSWQPWYVSEWDATQLYCRFNLIYKA